MGHFLMVLRYVSVVDFAVGTLPLSVVVSTQREKIMGDWQNIMSMDGDYAPWDSPGWGDDTPRNRRRSPRPELSSAQVFETFQEAASWARDNPGRSFSRDPNGDGFIVK